MLIGQTSPSGAQFEVPTTDELTCLQSVITRFPELVRPGIESLRRVVGNAAGFSGGAVWRGLGSGGRVALRRLPANYSPSRLEAIHRIQQFMGRTGFKAVAAPLLASNNRSVVEWGGYCWELSPWLPGQAQESSPPAECRIRSAAQLLARFHRLGYQLNPEHLRPHIADDSSVAAFVSKVPTISPGLLRRQSEWLRLRPLLDRSNDHLATAARPAVWIDLVNRTHAAIARRRSWLDEFAKSTMPKVQLALTMRDVHREHVLFEGDAATGLIDFGAIGLDAAACDLGRYLGSCAHDRNDLWEAAFAAYRQEHKLETDAIRLARLFDATGTLLGALHWYEWLVDERRQFANPVAAVARWTSLVERIERMPTSPSI